MVVARYFAGPVEISRIAARASAFSMRLCESNPRHKGCRNRQLWTRKHRRLSFAMSQ